MAKRCAVALVILAASLPLLSFAAAPNVTRIIPAAAIPGQTTKITFLGDDLQGPVALWTSFPADISPVQTSSAATFALKVPSNAATGLGAIRLVTTNGLSGLNLFLIDPIQAVTASKTNHSAESAQPLSGPIAVDGVCEELRSDFYRITAKKAERVSIEVVAQRLGSPLDPLIRVTDPRGRELAANDDATSLGSDARLDFRSPKNGDYLVEVRDTRYNGGPRHHYRLRIGKPLPSPLPFLAGQEVTSLTSAQDALPSLPEREPNDTGDQAQNIQLPSEVAGQFAKPGDRDVYEFTVRKGERIVFIGQSRSVGSPGDLFFQLQATNGAKIAEANASAGDEGILTNRFSEAGVYRLVVEELNQLGGPDFSYRLAMRSLTPGFTLRSETDRISVPAGESFEVEVLATRRDYDGPIHLKVEGLPEAFAVTNAIIAAKTNSTKITIKVPADLSLGDLFHFSITGSTENSAPNASERVSTLPALRAAFPALRHVPRDLDGLFALSISERKSSNPKPPQKKRKK